jgi:hypothetical protein
MYYLSDGSREYIHYFFVGVFPSVLIFFDQRSRTLFFEDVTCETKRCQRHNQTINPQKKIL